MSASARTQATLERFSAELTRWAARMNLVGSTAPDALARHVADSLAAAEHLPRGARVVDLGSGAGFPGIPIAIARPDLDLQLVEIREKRVAFLRHVVRELELGARVERVSIEEPPEERFDFALLRAVSPPPRSLELGSRWVRPDGEVWIWAGADTLLPHARPFPLASGGAILRVRAADISRGTS